MAQIRHCDLRRALLAGLCFSPWLAAPKPAAAEDWPWWRGPRHDGSWRAPANLPETFPAQGPPRLWRKPLGGGYSGITTSEGQVYTMDRPRDGEERIVCLALETGELLWEFRYAADYGDLDYGSGPRASVTISDGLIYALGAVGHLHCLRAADGTVVWSTDTVRDHGARRPAWGFAASPLVSGELLITHLGAEPGGCYVAFDRRTGEIRWKSGSDPAGYSTPVPARHGDQDLLLCWTPLHVGARDPRDGRLLWEYPYAVQYGVSIADPVLHGDTVLVCGYWHGSRALRLGDDPRQSTLRWEREDLCGLMAQPLYRPPHVYLLDRSRGLTCFLLESGEVVWNDGEHRLTPEDRHPHATLVDLAGTDRALALNSNGELIQFRLSPQGYTELDRTQVIGKTWAHPGFSGRLLLARSDREIVCCALADPLDSP